jgi:4-carboxymuconolactone decarboxylase
MARVPILKSPDDLTGDARRIAEQIVDTRKTLDGPFSVWMHAPEWAERVAHLGSLVRWEGTLAPRLRTLAALVTGRHFQAQYVWGIQGVIGAERNIPRSTIDAIRDEQSDGVPPDDLQIIDFTRQLLRKNRIDEPLAQAVMQRLGYDQYVQLTTCIGYYAMLAMTVNGAELPPNPGHEALKI